MKKLSLLVVAVVAALTIAQAQEKKYTPTPENLKNREWFQDARFGLFIHWGVYSVLGDGEWVMNNQQIPGEPITADEMQAMYKWVDELRKMTNIELMWIVALCIVRGKIREPRQLMNDVIKERIHQNISIRHGGGGTQ